MDHQQASLSLTVYEVQNITLSRCLERDRSSAVLAASGSIPVFSRPRLATRALVPLTRDAGGSTVPSRAANLKSDLIPANCGRRRIGLCIAGEDHVQASIFENLTSEQ